MRGLMFMTLVMLLSCAALVEGQTNTGDLPSPLDVANARQQARAKAVETQDPSNNQNQNQNQSKITTASLFRELDNLIPGEFSDDSPQKKAMMETAEAFFAGKFRQASDALEAQAKLDPRFPPRELLIAGLWYAVNNGKQGKVFLEEAAIKHSAYPGVFSAFARLAINQGRLTDALALLEKSDRLLSAKEFSEVERKHFRGIYLDAMIDVALRQRRYDDARTYVDEMQALTPDTAKGLLAMAELDFQDGKVDDSLQYLEKLRSKVTATRVPELILASWYQRSGDQENIEKYINKAAEKYPNDQVVQLEFANFSIAKENFQAARKAIEAMESRLGEKADTLMLKAKIAFAMRTYGDAESHYEKLTKMLPQNFDAANMYALSLAESSDETKLQLANQIATRNFQQLPNNLIATAALGWVSLKSGNMEQASQLLKRAAQTPRLAPEVAYYLASLLHRQSQSQQARLILEPALKSDGFFLYRGAAKALLKEIEKDSGDFLPSPGK